MKKTTLKEFLNVLSETEIDLIVNGAGIVVESSDLAVDFHTLITTKVSLAANEISKQLDAIIAQVALKIKPWALENLHSAAKIGSNTALFKKILDNPEAAAKQLVVAQFKKMVDAGKIPKELHDYVGNY